MANYSGSFSGSFTGSLLATNGVISSSAQVIGSLPIGVISGSSQIDANSLSFDYYNLTNLPVTITPFQANSILANNALRDNFASNVKVRLNAENVLSGSLKEQLPIGTISSSNQLISEFDDRYANELGDGLVSSSAQITLLDTDRAGFDTDNVPEGSNLYYTDARVRTVINTKGVISSSAQISEYDVFLEKRGFGVISSSAQLTSEFDDRYGNELNDGLVSSSAQITLLDTDRTGFDTGDVPEGSNLYYTDARVKTLINTKGVISSSAQISEYDTFLEKHGFGVISSSLQLIDEFDNRYANELGDGLISSSAQITLLDTDRTGFDTGDIPEGTNLYYTDARVKTLINTKGVISSSAQISEYDTFLEKRGLGVISSSAQLTDTLLEKEGLGVISSSAQITALGFSTTDNDAQTLTLAGQTLSISNGNSVILPAAEGGSGGASIWNTGSQDPNTYEWLQTSNNLKVTGSFDIKGDLTVNGQSIFIQTSASDAGAAVVVEGRLKILEEQIGSYVASASIQLGNSRDTIDCGGFF